MAETNSNTRLQKATSAIQNNFNRLNISDKIRVSKNTISVFGDVPTTKHKLFVVFCIGTIITLLLVICFIKRLSTIEEAIAVGIGLFFLATGTLLMISMGQTVLIIDLGSFSIKSENTGAICNYFNTEYVIGFKEIANVSLVRYVGISSASSYRITVTEHSRKETILIQMDYRSVENALIAQQIKKLLVIALWEFNKGNRIV